jgi:hypothetical protein
VGACPPRRIIRHIQPRALGEGHRRIHWCHCNLHHSAVHRVGDERGWWAGHRVDPEPEAERLWRESQRAAPMGDGPLREITIAGGVLNEM